MIKGPCPESELAALKYVAEHTSIPVPRVFHAHYYQDYLYIEMEYIRGMDLGAARASSHLSQDQTINIVTEVAGYINQLRELKPPREGIVASASLGELMDHRVGVQRLLNVTLVIIELVSPTLILLPGISWYTMARSLQSWIGNLVAGTQNIGSIQRRITRDQIGQNGTMDWKIV
ncbi:unnamed protein product [Penicillium bialowiezense]